MTPSVTPTSTPTATPTVTSTPTVTNTPVPGTSTPTTVPATSTPTATPRPHEGHSAFGQHIAFWRFVNLDAFLYWSAGGAWTEQFQPGDITLEYDVHTRLLTKSDTLSRFCLDGELTGYTIQYIDYLIGSNAYPGRQGWR